MQLQRMKDLLFKTDPILDGYHAACGTACGILSEPPGTGALIIGAVLYSNAMVELGRTTQAERLLEKSDKRTKDAVIIQKR